MTIARTYNGKGFYSSTVGFGRAPDDASTLLAMPAFEPRAYWEERLGRGPAWQAVGHAGLGAGLNAWVYAVRGRVFEREARAVLRERPAPSVLDVGSGTGYFLRRWAALGARDITGSDIADAAVERLRSSLPAIPVHRFELGAPLPEALAARRFDAVSAIDVLYHVLDDDAYARAFRQMHDVLKPGGLLLFSEAFLHGDELRLPHQRCRRIEQIERVVRDAGFEILRRRPLFVLLYPPQDSTSRLHALWWRGLAGVAARSEVAGRLLGALLYLPELALVSLLREGPSTELMVCRRSG